MKISSMLVSALASAVLAFSSSAQNYAATVIDYNPGTTFAAGFTNPSTVLGPPSSVNPFGEATDPFNPPYGTNQLLSIGEGGSVTVKFERPVHNRARRTKGIDFNVFGNSGFVITNDFNPVTFAWIGEPATDGSLFGANTGGETRVSVSRDGVHFYDLAPAHAPLVDELLPTDGAGEPTRPADPSLKAADFPGQTLEGIRSLYGGSAGGAGFNLSWARTRRGRPIHLSFIRYVRVTVLRGKSEIDAFSATLPNK